MKDVGVNPARAGMIPSRTRDHDDIVSKPRASGDDPGCEIWAVKMKE